MLTLRGSRHSRVRIPGRETPKKAVFHVRLGAIENGLDGKRVWTTLMRDGTMLGAAIGPDGLRRAQ